MHLVDWLILTGFLGISLVVGLLVRNRAGRSTSDFFLSGRSMPWWLLGVSMVATTFSADTPNLVADIVRQNGVAGNWSWWAFLLTGMLTVFVYAKLWRRSGVATDLEFYELRYSGNSAAFLRGFRAIYLGVFFNILVMAVVCLAAIKIMGCLLNVPPVLALTVACTVTVVYSSLGGLTGVLITDFLQFMVAMAGSIGAAVYVVKMPEIGGLSALLNHSAVTDKLSLLPSFDDPDQFIPLLLVPLAVQWWASWYPGAEPGGGGYVAQRMLSAKNETHAVGATLLFNIAHYALRPWPWILVALASCVLYPDLADLQAAFPAITDDKIGHDVSYPAMISLLPTGLLGLVVASLVAAFMSTISTHLNWGASYLVNDVYRRFVRPEANEKELVRVGRVATIALMVVSALLALFLQNAKQAFDIIIMVGAGTGLLFILRWFWWRITPASEITAMLASFVISFYMAFYFDRSFDWAEAVPGYLRFVLSVAITTVAWLVATYLSEPTEQQILLDFCRKIRPGGPGWKRIYAIAEEQGSPIPSKGSTQQILYELVCVLVGTVGVYSALFATGNLLYGNQMLAGLLGVCSLGSLVFVLAFWRKICS